MFCSRNVGAHVQCTGAKKLVSSNFAKILKVATKIRETCEKTLFTPSSPHTRFAWAGRTFFPVVLLCCVSFWFWREVRELALHYFPADCFGIKREIDFLVLRTYLVYNTVVQLCLFCCCLNTLQSRSFLKNIKNFLCKKIDPI